MSGALGLVKPVPTGLRNAGLIIPLRAFADTAARPLSWMLGGGLGWLRRDVRLHRFFALSYVLDVFDAG
jgi:hypothetical protein